MILKGVQLGGDQGQNEKIMAFIWSLVAGNRVVSDYFRERKYCRKCEMIKRKWPFMVSLEY